MGSTHQDSGEPTRLPRVPRRPPSQVRQKEVDERPTGHRRTGSTSANGPTGASTPANGSTGSSPSPSPARKDQDHGDPKTPSQDPGPSIQHEAEIGRPSRGHGSPTKPEEYTDPIQSCPGTTRDPGTLLSRPLQINQGGDSRRASSQRAGTRSQSGSDSEPPEPRMEPTHGGTQQSGFGRATGIPEHRRHVRTRRTCLDGRLALLGLLLVVQGQLGSPTPSPDQDQPFSYERKFDLAQQKVIFHPIGQYATDVTFAHIELRVPFQPYFELAEELDHDVNKVKNISRMLKQTNKDDGYWKERDLELAKILDSNLAVAIFPAYVALNKLNQTIYKLPHLNREDDAFAAHGRYRRATRADAQEEDAHHAYLRQKRQIETLIGVGASFIGFL